MQFIKYLFASTLLLLLALTATHAQPSANDRPWRAQWIMANQNQNATSTWQCFRKDVKLTAKPAQATARIAADTKYWLWVNGTLVVFEGGLKRGPTPQDTYYDEVDLAPYLQAGDNTLAVLTWYFGKEGFSHKSSGSAGFLFECLTPELPILSDRRWKARVHPAYELAPSPLPNFRLAESHLRFDARQDLGTWQVPGAPTPGFGAAQELGRPPTAPWNRLVRRPMPFWKDSGLKEYVSTRRVPGPTADTLVCDLPANIHITPYLDVEAPGGVLVTLLTDNYLGGGTVNLRAEYVTRAGRQQYESYGWLNGHKVLYVVPKNVTVHGVKYRETGYDTDFAGSFTSSDPFLNKLWEKSRRTLYVTMRDTYMDCPDRERAQWWGDEVNESGEAFYALCPKSHALHKKGMYELIGWQRADSSLFSPIPAGNWSKELPGQMLSSVGYYGFWNYYLHTGDRQPMADLYEGVKKYLHLWPANADGTVAFRQGDWTWGDWGENIDRRVLFNTLYQLALKGARNMALLLDKSADADAYQKRMAEIKQAFNKQYWNGTAYRHPDYKGETDDRCQALAVVAGLADEDKYPALFKVLQQEEHASPYMEKYVLEALFLMRQETYALQRMQKRFGYMVNHPDYTTLFEGWGIGAEGYGGGTVNHAWSGGGLTILSQYLCGIAPLEPGYGTFQVMPQPGPVARASQTVASVKGTIKSTFVNQARKFTLDVEVPTGTTALVGIPDHGFSEIRLNKKVVWRQGKYLKRTSVPAAASAAQHHVAFEVPGGNWTFEASK
ncbi:hypothetical protein GCM10027275_21320 [Rhabdobacter roseus]|uniref:Glycoside hydrolase n=1 Tax=Rhabdobacter roseus TaxID=1655419 RepID=A0A840TQS3_9BACT|nr:alpha-L-rhamnosidase C-terminal domain-containing protein [Rhabdobacter roseus]MBB5284067.1 hypothetical protein [Rhabdobacter roseus]